MIDINHPKQQVVFFLVDDYDENIVKDLGKLIDKLSHTWLLKKPEFIDEVDDENLSFEDIPLRTVGLVFYIYSALPPWGDKLPKDIDKKHLDEIKYLVAELACFSRNKSCELALEIDGSQIGWIENGIPDEGITETLISEWENTL